MDFCLNDLLYLTGDTATPEQLSAPVVSSQTDALLDQKFPSNGEIEPAIPVVDDIPMKDAESSINGIKRKSRESKIRPSYAEAESSDDDLPLVCISCSNPTISTLADDM